MQERRGTRPETIESNLPEYVQKYIWDKTIQFTEALIPTIYDVDTLVDYLRAVNLRAANAGNLNEHDWKNRLYQTKYRLLLKAAEMRKEGHNINIENKTVIERWGIEHETLLFKFATEPNVFTTSTRRSNLLTVVGEDTLTELIEMSNDQNQLVA